MGRQVSVALSLLVFCHCLVDCFSMGRVLATSSKDVEDKRYPLRNVPFSVIDAYNELYRARRMKESHKLPKKRFYFTRIGRFAPPPTDEKEPQTAYEAH